MVTILFAFFGGGAHAWRMILESAKTLVEKNKSENKIAKGTPFQDRSLVVPKDCEYLGKIIMRLNL